MRANISTYFETERKHNACPRAFLSPSFSCYVFISWRTHRCEIEDIAHVWLVVKGEEAELFITNKSSHVIVSLLAFILYSLYCIIYRKKQLINKQNKKITSCVLVEVHLQRLFSHEQSGCLILQLRPRRVCCPGAQLITGRSRTTASTQMTCLRPLYDGLAAVRTKRSVVNGDF